MDAKENKQENKEFVNPFQTGVSLDEFIKAVGTKNVADYLKGQTKNEVDGELYDFTPEDVKYLEKEIKNHAYNKKNKDAFLKQANEDYAALVMNNTKKIEQ